MDGFPGAGDFDATRAAVELGLMELENSIQPIYAAAERVKATFIKMGWSPENAEKAALAWFAGLFTASAGGSR